MEFICVSCQVRMVAGERSQAGSGEEGDSLMAFGCPACGHALALAVTPLEAALVRTLGMTVPGLHPPPSPTQATSSPSTIPSPDRLLWSEEAARALMGVPADQQAIVKRTVESAAKARGAPRVTAALLTEVTAQIEL